MKQKYATSTEKMTGVIGHTYEENIESTSTKIDMKDKNEQTYGQNDKCECITEKTCKMKQKVDGKTESIKIELIDKMKQVNEKTSTHNKARSSNLENSFEQYSNSYEKYSWSQVLDDLSTYGKCSGSQQKRKVSDLQLDPNAYGKRPRLDPNSFVSSWCSQEDTNFYQGNSRINEKELKDQEQNASVPQKFSSPLHFWSSLLPITEPDVGCTCLINYPLDLRESTSTFLNFASIDQCQTQGPAGIPNPGTPNLPGQPLPPPPPVNDPPPAKT